MSEECDAGVFACARFANGQGMTSTKAGVCISLNAENLLDYLS